MFLITIYWYINKIKKFLGLIHEREPYLLGKTKLTVNKTYEVLIPLGYQWDYFAWEDVGEGISVRKLYADRQVHVRIFPNDGEVRSHDELNYEFDPLGHYNGETLTIPVPEEIEMVESALKVKKIEE